MRSFGRSIVLPSWQKPKIFVSGNRGSDEDEAYLLAPDEGREQETLRDYCDEVSLEHEDYVRKATVLEAYCKSLEARISEIQQSNLEQKAIHENQDKESIIAMKSMREYVDRLEDENKILRETCGKHEHRMHIRRIETDMSCEALSNCSPIVDTSDSLRNNGADWNIVLSMARKLSQAQKENESLKDAKAAKREATEELKENIIAMRIMREKINGLEDENNILLETFGKQEHRTDTRKTETDMSCEAASNGSHSVDTSNRRRNNGPEWHTVLNMARKLSQAQKENKSLKDAMAAKRAAIEELIGSTTTLTSQLEDAQYENQHLTSQCQSLNDVYSFRAKETDNSENPPAENHEKLFLQARVDELEEMNGLLKKELQDLKAVLVVTTVPAPSEDRDGECSVDLVNVGDGSDSNGTVLVRSVKVSSEPLNDVVETVDENSDIDPHGDDEGVPCGDLKEMQLSKPLISQTEEITSQKGHEEASDCSSETVSEGERVDGLGPLPSNPFGSNLAEQCNGSRSASLEEMQKYLQEVMALQMSTVPTDHETCGVETSPSKEDWPTSQEISDSRLEILKSMEKHQSWREKLLCRLKDDGTKDVSDNGVWC